MASVLSLFLRATPLISLLAAAPAFAADIAAGQVVFKTQCSVCHAIVPGKNGVGPSLAGIVGRKAATAPKFNYSPAMKASTLTWDAKTLDKYLINPKATVPATRMAYAGQKDATKRANLVAYLATLK